MTITANSNVKYDLIGKLVHCSGNLASFPIASTQSHTQLCQIRGNTGHCAALRQGGQVKHYGSPHSCTQVCGTLRQVSKLRIIRATKDSKGAARKLPWYIEVENGKGIPQKNANGGTYMKPNSFVSTGKVYANLSDLDLFDLLSSVSSYIDCWEHAIRRHLSPKPKTPWQQGSQPGMPHSIRTI